MKIIPDIFPRYTLKQVQVVLFSLLVTGFILPPVFSGSWLSGHPVLAKEPGPPIILQEPTPKKFKKESQQKLTEKNFQIPALEKSPSQKLTKEQQQLIIEKNVRIRKLQEGIIDHKIKILGSRKKERTLLGDLEKIEKELQLQKNMIATLRTQSEKQELLLTDKQEYLRRVLAEKRKHQIIVKKRLAAYYRMGSVGLMNVAFSAESLPELLEFNEHFTQMVQHDHTIIQKYLDELKESNRAREEHALEKLRLMKLTDEVKEKETELTLIRQEKNLLLKKVNTEQQLYERAVVEIEEAVADLALTLQKVQAAAGSQPVAAQSGEETEPAKKKPLEQPDAVQEGFTAMKGHLDPPVAGTVTSLFGQQIKGKFDSSSTANGIDIKVMEGIVIKAVYEGKIIHSGYLRGYGNLMIIDHGQQYFSLISRAAEFYKKEGSRALTGEVIGVTGEKDPLYGEGLHFEIRRGAIPEDPLSWLRKDALSIAATTTAVK